MADEDKLDKVLNHLDALHTKIDSIDAEHKKDRADAAEWKARADAAAAEKDRSDKARTDAEAKEKEEKEKADKMCADAEAKEKEEKEKADKARKDAEEKEGDEKEKADAALRAGNNSELAKKLAEMERRMPAILSDDDKARFAEVQMRCDAAYQAWNYGQAPHALQGETFNDYRVRLLAKLKSHSKVYKDSNLGILVNDSAAFSVVENAIVTDAVEASSSQVTIGAPLRELVTRNDSGHTVRKFIGDPAVTWGAFMGGATKFGRINRDVGR
jgi:hypothetical protein